MGGKPASAPAMSKPATPRSRQAIDSSAISIERAAWRIAVSSWRTTIRPPAAAIALLEAALHRADDLVQGEAGGDVLLGGVADLGVHHSVGGEVLDALAGHPLDRRGGLHDPDRVVEGLEVAHQRAGVGRLREPAAQRLRVAGRELVAAVGGQLEDRSAGAALRRGGRAAGPWERGVRRHGWGGWQSRASSFHHLRPACAPPEPSLRGRRVVSSEQSPTPRSRRSCACSAASTRWPRPPTPRSARPSGWSWTRSGSTSSPTRPTTTSGSTSTSRRRTPGPSADRSRTATSRCRCCPTSAARS